MGIALIDASRNYKDSESSVESLTSESKLILIYISIVCVILLSSLIIMICWGCEIVGKDKLILRSNTRTFKDGSGNEIKVMNVKKSNSVQLPVKTSIKIERMISVWFISYCHVWNKCEKWIVKLLFMLTSNIELFNVLMVINKLIFEINEMKITTQFNKLYFSTLM